VNIQVIEIKRLTSLQIPIQINVHAKITFPEIPWPAEPFSGFWRLHCPNHLLASRLHVFRP
jgi:hypothetical protein